LCAAAAASIYLDYAVATGGGKSMSDSLPLSLILAYVGFFCFLNTHQRHVSKFGGTGQAYQMLLYGSLVVGFSAGLCLMVNYGIQTAWYWPVILFLTGSVMAGLISSFLEASMGIFVMSLAGFLGWPICAYLMYEIIKNLGS
jgi:hypothetical protein